MVKHIILWKIKTEFSKEEAQTIKENAKSQLEALVGKVPGLKELTVITTPLSSSNADLMLDSTMESEAALKGYAIHPDHVHVADTYVRPFMETRLCIDYEV